MAKDYKHPVRNGPTQASFYGKIAKDIDINEALDELRKKRHEWLEAMHALGTCVCNNTGMNAFQQLQVYRAYAPQLVKSFNVVYALSNYFAAQLEVLEEKSVANKNKKWTKEEDEKVINMLCDGATELEIAIKTGRSIGAIHTRVSNLVGISKERKIEGEFSGVVDGKPTSGTIKGVYKKER